MITGRIIKGVGGLYTVKTEQGVYQCKARGLFRKKNIIPTVGDWADIQVTHQEDMEGYLINIRERENLLLRPRVANVDQAIILFASQEPAFNHELLDRLIVLVEETGIDICIGLNKMDLGGEESYQMLKNIYEDVGYKVFSFAALEGRGISELIPCIEGKISVLAGPSGAGKSSIVNRLFNAELMETGTVSEKIGRGKHTTRHAELLEYSENSFIADTPGFSSLELNHIPARSLAEYFREFAPYLNQCRFNDCSHISEPDCAVKEQVGKKIHPLRYEHYINLYKEVKE